MSRILTTGILNQRNGDDLLLNLYPGAGFAYSLRSLRRGVTRVVRVRREIDNAESDFTPEQILDGTLVTWCSGEAGYVTAWYNQSGTVDTAVMAVTTQQGRIVSDTGVLETWFGKPSINTRPIGSQTWLTRGAAIPGTGTAYFIVGRSGFGGVNRGFGAWGQITTSLGVVFGDTINSSVSWPPPTGTSSGGWAIRKARSTSPARPSPPPAPSPATSPTPTRSRVKAGTPGTVQVEAFSHVREKSLLPLFRQIPRVQVARKEVAGRRRVVMARQQVVVPKEPSREVKGTPFAAKTLEFLLFLAPAGPFPNNLLCLHGEPGFDKDSHFINISIKEFEGCFFLLFGWLLQLPPLLPDAFQSCLHVGWQLAGVQLLSGRPQRKSTFALDRPLQQVHKTTFVAIT